MNLKATFRLRLLLAFYCGVVGYFTFEVLTLALAAVMPNQYFCYYELLHTRTLIIVFCYSAAGFIFLPYFFSPQSYNLGRSVKGGAVSYALAHAVLTITLSQPQFAKGFLLSGEYSLLTILLAKHGIFLSSPLYQAPINTLVDDLGNLSIYFTVSFLIASIFGALLAWPLYRYTFHHNTGQAYWR